MCTLRTLAVGQEWPLVFNFQNLHILKIRHKHLHIHDLKTDVVHIIKAWQRVHFLEGLVFTSRQFGSTLFSQKTIWSVWFSDIKCSVLQKMCTCQNCVPILSRSISLLSKLYCTFCLLMTKDDTDGEVETSSICFKIITFGCVIFQHVLYLFICCCCFPPAPQTNKHMKFGLKKLCSVGKYVEVLLHE